VAAARRIERSSWLFAEVVVRVEHDAALVDVLAEHRAGAGCAVVACRGEHHRVRLDDSGRGGIGEPAGQLLVPGAVEITDVQLVRR
jgi:hypothetical protein